MVSINGVISVAGDLEHLVDFDSIAVCVETYTGGWNRSMLDVGYGTIAPKYLYREFKEIWLQRQSTSPPPPPPPPPLP